MMHLRKAAFFIPAALVVSGVAAVLAMKADASESPAPPVGHSHAVLAAAPRPPRPPEPPTPPAPPDDVEEDGVFVLSGGAGFLGIQIEDVTDEKATALKLRETYGALVTTVQEDTPAARAGIKDDDVVVSYQGQRVEGAAALRRMVRETPAGRTVRLGYVRDGDSKTVEVKIEDRERGRRWSSRRGFTMPEINIPEIDIPGVHAYVYSSKPRLGVMIDNLSSQLAEHFGVKGGKGVLVTEVIEDTPAERGGIKAGDVIVKVDGTSIEDVGDLHDAMEGKEGKALDVTFVRDKSEQTIKVTLDEAKSEERRHSHDDALREEIRRSLDETRRAQHESMEARRQAMESLRESLDQMRREKSEAYREMMRERQKSAPLIGI